MSSITFNTHSFVKRMKSAGFTDEQAEIQAETLNSALIEFQDQAIEKLATRDDLNLALAETKTDIIKWVAGMLIAQIAVGVTMFKLLG